MLWCTLLVALALIASVVATRIVLFRHLSQETDSELSHELDEVGLGQRSHVGAQTNRPFIGTEHQLRTALSRATPSRSQELLAISNGRVLARSPNRPIHAQETDPHLVRLWAAVKSPTFATIHASAGTVRYLAVPITVMSSKHPGSDVFVAASFVDRERADVNTTVEIASTVGLVALLMAILIAWLIAGRILAPVRELEVVARSVTESDLTHRLEVKGDDELARLAADFNAMLDRVESAFRSQRQFIDDAGHELRTPLTVIRGHLELLGDDPIERNEVRAIIIDELDRMSRMVNDLLVLARAERPDFLQLAQVDVHGLTAEVQDKATSLADRHWLDGGRANGELLADRQRLTQAWMQLAQNATQHTSAGDRIELGSRINGNWLDMWVSDSGAGVPHKMHDRIFQGFSRADHAHRNGEHFGLGLPIVRAIAEAHSGQMSVGASTLGGALFTIRIPMSLTAESHVR